MNTALRLFKREMCLFNGFMANSVLLWLGFLLSLYGYCVCNDSTEDGVSYENFS